MHSDLLMLRVACRVVEGDRRQPPNDDPKPTSTMPTTTTTNDSTTNIMLPRLVLPTISMSTATSTAPWDAHRIPTIPTLHRPHAPATDAADLMLGLKRAKRSANEMEQDQQNTDELHQHQTPRPSPKRVRLPPPPGVFMDSPLAKLVNAQRTTVLPVRSPLGVEGMMADDKSQTRVLPATFMAFMDQSLTRPPVATAGDEEDEDEAEDVVYEKLSPLESPRIMGREHATATTLRLPKLPQWRSPVLGHSPQQPAPLPSLSLATTRAPRSAAPMPPLVLPIASTKPTLLRTSSAAWRQAMPAVDRTRTRERMLRGVHRQCRGDAEALMAIVAALEEELLHAHTNAKDHYFYQTVALRDRIATIVPPRTAYPPL